MCEDLGPVAAVRAASGRGDGCTAQDVEQRRRARIQGEYQR
jgi:hypothetical protein